MCFEKAIIWPHGLSLIPDLAGEELPLFQDFYEILEGIAQRIKKMQPEFIFLITPHGVRVEGEMLLYLTEQLEGYLSQNQRTLHIKTTYQRDMAESLLQRVKEEKLNMKSMVYGTAAGIFSVAPMDWATFIPLWWIQKAYGEMSLPPVIVLSVDGTKRRHNEYYVDLGAKLERIFSSFGQRGLWISSADQGHCHDPNGFYGYHQSSSIFDEEMCKMAETFSFEKLNEMESALIQEAKTDSILQTLLLYGAMKNKKIIQRELFYKAPTYFGMMVAEYDISK